MLLRKITKHVTDQNKTHVIARSEATWQSHDSTPDLTDCRGRTSLAMTVSIENLQCY
jgi:hypothetical protein